MSLPISSEGVAQVTVIIGSVGLGLLFVPEDADTATSVAGMVVVGVIGAVGITCIEVVSKWYQNLVLERENHCIGRYRVAPPFFIDPSQIDDRTMERALEKIRGFKSYQWHLKDEKIDQKKILEYWKRASSIAKGTCLAQASALLHAEINDNEPFSLQNSFNCLNPEEIISWHCALRLFSTIKIRKGYIDRRFLTKQIEHRVEQVKQLLVLLKETSEEKSKGVVKEIHCKQLKQYARDISDPDLERIVDQFIQFPLYEWQRELEQWVRNPPGISVADKALKLKKYEDEEERLAHAIPGIPLSWSNITFLTDSSPEEYRVHLESAIESSSSRIRDGVITGIIVLPGHRRPFQSGHAMTFQYGPEEYFIYDPGHKERGLFKYPNKEDFFEGMSLIVQNFMRYVMHEDPNTEPTAFFHIFNKPETAP